MVKTLSAVALAGLLALPAAVSAGANPNVEDFNQKIEELSRQLDELRAIVTEQYETKEAQEAVLDDLDDKSEGWDLASRTSSLVFSARVWTTTLPILHSADSWITTPFGPIGSA